jgi:hypothetical protein
MPTNHPGKLHFHSVHYDRRCSRRLRVSPNQVPRCKAHTKPCIELQHLPSSNMRPPIRKKDLSRIFQVFTEVPHLYCQRSIMPNTMEQLNRKFQIWKAHFSGRPSNTQNAPHTKFLIEIIAAIYGHARNDFPCVK